MSADLPSIDELVSLLQRYDPQELSELRIKYPGHAELFKPGVKMGSSRLVVGEGRENEIEMGIRSETALAGIEQAERVCVSLISEIQGLINRVDKLQLIMQILTLVSGATIFVVLKSTYGTVVTYVLATINLVASIVALVGKHLGSRDNRKPAEDYKHLIESRLEAEQVLMQLKLWKERSFLGVPGQLIKQANQVSARINEIETHNYWTDLPAKR